MASSDVIWSVVNSFHTHKRAAFNGKQFSGETGNLSGLHTRTHSGYLPRAVDISLDGVGKAAKIVVATKKQRAPHKVAGGRTVTVLRGDLKANSRGLNNSVQALVKNARRHDLVSIALSRVSRLRKTLKPTKPRKPKTRRVDFVKRRKIVKDALRKQKSADIKEFLKNKAGTKPRPKNPEKIKAAAKAAKPKKVGKKVVKKAPAAAKAEEKK